MTADLLKDEQALLAVEDRSRLVPAAFHPGKLLEDGGFAQALPDRVDVERRAHQNGAVRAEQRHRVLGAEIQFSEQAVEVADAHAAGDDPAERAVVVGDAPAQTDQILSVVGDPRAADEQPGVGPGGVNLKEIMPCVIRLGRDQRPRIHHDPAETIEHEDRAHVLCGGRTVEQHDLPQLAADPVDIGQFHAVHGRLQRQIVELDVSLDLARQAGDQIGRGRPAVQVVAVARMPENPAADRGKAQGNGEPQRQQPLGRRNLLSRDALGHQRPQPPRRPRACSFHSVIVFSS